MNGRLRTTGKVLIAAFFAWHAFSVATYAIPLSAQDPFTRALRDAAVSVNRGYVLSLSQWQQWNLFSPDPMRRVPSYAVEREASPSTWEPVATITPESFSWWQQSTRYKMLLGSLEQDQDTYTPLIVEHFVRSYCAPNGFPAGTKLRLAYRPYVVPRPESFLKAFAPGPWPPEYLPSATDPIACL